MGNIGWVVNSMIYHTTLVETTRGAQLPFGGGNRKFLTESPDLFTDVFQFFILPYLFFETRQVS